MRCQLGGLVIKSIFAIGICGIGGDSRVTVSMGVGGWVRMIWSRAIVREESSITMFA